MKYLNFALIRYRVFAGNISVGQDAKQTLTHVIFTKWAETVRGDMSRGGPCCAGDITQWPLSSFGFWKTQLNGLAGRCLHKYECVKIWTSIFSCSTLLLFEIFISLFPPSKPAAVEAASDRTSLIIFTPQFVSLTRLMIHISHEEMEWGSGLGDREEMRWAANIVWLVTTGLSESSWAATLIENYTAFYKEYHNILYEINIFCI